MAYKVGQQVTIPYRTDTGVIIKIHNNMSNCIQIRWTNVTRSVTSEYPDTVSLVLNGLEKIKKRHEL